MIDTALFKIRFKEKIKNNYGSVGEFAEAARSFVDSKGNKPLEISLPTVYRWTSASSPSIPKESQREAICAILGVSPVFLFPPAQTGLIANYYIGFLEGVLLGSYSQHENMMKKKNIDLDKVIIVDDDDISTAFWRTIYLYKDKTVVEQIDKKFKEFTTRPSLESLLFDRLFNDQHHREYLVELALLLVHYMGGKIQLFDKRIELALKARETAEALSNDLTSDPEMAEWFRSAYFLLSIDALAWMYMRVNRVKEAIEILEDALRKIVPDERPNTFALCLIFLARAYFLDGQKDTAFKKLTEAQTILPSVKNHLIRIRYLMIQGDILRAEGKTNSAQAAFTAYTEAKQIQDLLGIDFDTSGLGYRIGHVYVDMALNAETLTREKFFDSATEIFEKIRHAQYDSIDRHHSLYGLARIAAGRHQTTKAHELANQAYNEYIEKAGQGKKNSSHFFPGEIKQFLNSL